MKRCFGYYLVICLLICSMIAVSTEKAFADRLGTATNLHWKSGSSATASWNEVEGANYYLVRVYTFSQNGEEVGVNETGTASNEIDLQQEIHRLDSSDSPVYVQFSVCTVTINAEETSYGEYSDLSPKLKYRFPLVTQFETPQNLKLSSSMDVSWDAIDLIDSSNYYYLDVRCTYNGKSYIQLTTSLSNSANILDTVRTICNTYSLNGKTVDVSFRVRGYSSTITSSGVAVTGEFSEWSSFVSYNSLAPIILATPQNPKLTETFAASWDKIDLVDSSNYYYLDVRCTYNGKSYIQLTTSLSNSANILDTVRTICNTYSLNGKTVDVTFRVRGYSSTITSSGVAVTGEFSEWSNSVPCLVPNPIVLATPQNPKLTETFAASWDKIDLVDSSNYYYLDVRCTYNGKSYIQLTTSLDNSKNILDTVRTICNAYSLNGKTVDVSFRVRGYSSTITSSGVAVTGEFSEWSNTVPYPERIVVSGLTLSPSAPILYLGNNLYLGKTITPENAYYTTIDWSTSDELTVLVTTTGRITGLKVGTASVTAQIGDASDSVTVTVYDISSNIEDESERDQVTDVAGDIIDSIVDEEVPDIGGTDIEEGNLPEIKEGIQEGIWRGDEFFTDIKWYEESFGKYKDNWGQIQKAARGMNAQFGGAYNIEVEMHHVDSAGNDYHIGNITELDNELTFTFELPTGNGKPEQTKRYVLVRIHNNTIEPIDMTVNEDGTFTAKSDCFSDFVLLYIDDTIDLSGCSTLTLPAGTKEIQKEAFIGTSAEVIIIPESCTSIAADVFQDCPNLKYIVNRSKVTLTPSDGVIVIAE